MSKFGLALGGGGARGLAHIGVLKVLEKENIKIDVITGCSMGAIVGGLYAYYGSAEKVENLIYDVIRNPKFTQLGIDKLTGGKKEADKNYFEQFFDYAGRRLQALKTLNQLSYFDEDISKDIYEVIPDTPVEDLKIKFSAIATDLLSGEEINFSKGSLRNILKASSAIPGIFPPVKYKDYFLVDGSASQSVPAGRVRNLGAERILAVNVMSSLETIEQPNNVIDILYRAEDITSFHLSVIRLNEADLIISPEVKKLSWADFDKVKEIISEGEKTAEDNIEKIKELANCNKYLLKIRYYLKRLSGNSHYVHR